MRLASGSLPRVSISLTVLDYAESARRIFRVVRGIAVASSLPYGEAAPGLFRVWKSSE